uniref:Lipase n=1 Tax=Culicoides sonorensis TaxID=179676 RepID=A0A336M341_CULSO
MVNSKILYDLLMLVNVTSIIFPQRKISDPINKQIRRTGYPGEVHTIYTDDGYRLRLHRIPYGYKKSQRNVTSREPLLLVHGALCSGSMWVHHPRKSRQALAFMLADAGYDVWLFSARGTSPSLGHKTLTIHDEKYWKFSWHEIGFYDIPKTIDYILMKTGKKTLYYAGHSQGCSVFAVAMSQKPEYNQKIKAAYLMSPGIYIDSVQGFIKMLIENRVGKFLEDFFKVTHIYWWPLRNPIINDVIFSFCNTNSATFICTLYLVEIIGPLSDNLEKGEFVKFFFEYIVDNIAVRQLVHLQTLVQKKSFVMYDYGNDNNEVYGSENPPEYDLSKISVPIAIMGAEDDALVTLKDVKKLANSLKPVKDLIILPGNHLEIFYIKKTANELKRTMIKSFTQV